MADYIAIIILLIFIGLIVLFVFIGGKVEKEILEKERERLEKERLERIEIEQLENDVKAKLGLTSWGIFPYNDIVINVRSRVALEKYDDFVFFKEDRSRLEKVEKVINEKNELSRVLQAFLKNNDFKEHKYYYVVEERVNYILKQCVGFKIHIDYISSAGNYLASKDIWITLQKVNMYKNDPTLLMAKSEYNKYLKEQEKEQLANKYKEYYGFVNRVIDYANENKDDLFIKGSQKKLDDLMLKLFDRTVNSIKKIKTIDSEEWGIISDFINNIRIEVEEIVNKNKKISEYYQSKEFAKVKESCEILMSSQREFNEYINEKVEFVSKLFGHKVFRNSTVYNDEYNYIRPYKKTITPLSIEVSAGVFASAENDPMKYIVKYFYPDKTMYKEQIDKLYILIEELETIKEAKQIIENYKLEYQQYLGDVPKYILKDDEVGFYSKLGFASIDESVLAVEYRFSYTSNGGMAQRSFTVPMTEENIIELISILENKLSKTEFVKEQRRLMTKKLRDAIKIRDNYTCCKCGNSIEKEPNLLLEIDHIVPIAKGGCTVDDNLQTLCWKCNRSKGIKIN